MHLDEHKRYQIFAILTSKISINKIACTIVYNELKQHLRHGKKKYRKRGSAKDKRGLIIGRISISERPQIVNEKSRFGDLEIDLINGANHKGNLLTINDRKSNYSTIRLLPSKDAGLLAKTIISSLKQYII